MATMRTRSAVACAALAATGCFFPGKVSRPAHKAAYVVDGALAALGVWVLIEVSQAPDDDPFKQGLKGFGASVIAAGAAGVLANVFLPAPEEAPPPPPPPRGQADPGRLALMRSWSPPLVDGADPQLVRSDALARAAAAYGECDVAANLVESIRSSAPRFYTLAVAPDPLLAACAGE
jgi:hypothetical protein